MKTTLTATLKWIAGNGRLSLEILSILALLVGGWAYNRKAQQLEDANAEHGKLADDLQSQLTIKNGELEILERDGNKVKVRRIFVPPEGHVVVKKKDQAALHKKYEDLLTRLGNASTDKEKDQIRKDIKDTIDDLNNGDEIVVKDKGFTFKPGMGAEIGKIGNDYFHGRLDLKLAYWKRYSFVVGASEAGIGLGASRHLDDILWFRPKNLEFVVGRKLLRFQPDSYLWFVAFRTNF